MTGVALQFEMVYKNTNLKRPTDFTPHLEILVSVATKGQWASKGPRIMTLPQNDGRWKLVERYEYATTIFFKVSGTIGSPSLFSAIYSFLIIIAGGVITFLLAEVMCGMFVNKYWDKKNFTENNWAMVTRLTLMGFQTGELQTAAMALGFKPVGPTPVEYAVGNFDSKAGKNTIGSLSLPEDKKKGVNRSNSIVYIGND